MASTELTHLIAQVYSDVRWSPITPTYLTGSSTANDCHIVL